MLTVKEAIEKRRAIRKFKPDPVPDAMIDQILEAARLAPSGTNRQSWRFQVIKDPALKQKVFEATVDQKHIQEAPVVIACGSELLTFVKGHPLAPPGGQYFGAENDSWEEISKFITDAHVYTAIAVEHMVLMATALGLGSCWVQRMRYGQVSKLLGWPRHIVILCLVPIGYPNEVPVPQVRISKQQMLITGPIP